MVNCYVLFCHQSRYYYKSYNNTVVLNKSCLGQLKLACLHLWDSSGISKAFYGHEHLEPHIPGTDPYFLKLFDELDTQPYTVFTTFGGPHGILWLGLVEKKLPPEHLDFLTCTLHKHLGYIFWRADIFTVDERSAPLAAETSQHQTKEVKHWNYRMQATNLNRVR